jgi:hypothetical protein
MATFSGARILVPMSPGMETKSTIEGIV